MEFNHNNELCSKIHLYLVNPKELEKLKIYLKNLRVENELLIKKNWLWVTDESQLQLEVIKKIHDQLTVGHLGTKRILKMTRRHYYWPRIKEMIQQFICNCYMCKQAKVAQDTYHDLLQPLPMLKQVWTDIIINFVVGLSKCGAYRQIYDIIFMVID